MSLKTTTIMKKLLFLFCIAAFSLTIQSQTRSTFANKYLGINNIPPPLHVLPSPNYREANKLSIDFRDFDSNNTTKVIDDAITTGSRFITDFQFGNIDGFNKDYRLRYDAFNDQMEIKTAEDKIVILNKETINEVRFDDGSNYTIYNYALGDKNITGYLKVIFRGSKSSLLKKEMIKYVFRKRVESGYVGEVPPAYKKSKDIYFIANHNGTVHSFRTKKDFLNLFPTKTKTLEKFIKSNTIKFSKEDSLTKLVKYLDSLD